MPQHNAQGNLCVGLPCSFSVGKQRTNFLDYQWMTSWNCIYFLYEANWSSTAQLHSDSRLNSEHHTTRCLSVQPFACYKDSSSLLNIDLAELPCNWNFDSLLSCDQSLVQNTHAHMHAHIQILCCRLKCLRNQQIPELQYSILSYFSCSGCLPYGKDFFNYSCRLRWSLPHSGPEIRNSQLMSSYWMLHFFLLI